MFNMQRRGLKSFIINAGFQFRVIWSFMALSLVSVAILFASVQYSFYRSKEFLKAAGFSNENLFYQAMVQQQQQLSYVFLGVCCVLILGFLMVGLVVSHRIAGPLYKLRKHMDDVASGYTSQDVYFRKRDYFPEIADGFNRVMARLRKLKNAGDDFDSKNRAA